MSNGLTAVETTIRRQQRSYFAKYRAFVADNKDPENRGRLRLIIPTVLGEAVSVWALPCVAYGGGADFGLLRVPPVDAQVVAEFLEGDPSAPMWTGTFWRTNAEVPSEYKGPSTKILKTESGHLLSFEDEEGGEQITLRTATEAELVMDPDGAISLTDSAGSKVVLDAAANEISIQDSNGNSMLMSASGITCQDVNGNEIKTSAGGIDLKASAVVNIEGAMVTIAGAGGEPLIKGSTFLGMFNSHTHPTGVGPSGPPVPPLTPAVLTTKSTGQ